MVRVQSTRRTYCAGLTSSFLEFLDTFILYPVAGLFLAFLSALLCASRSLALGMYPRAFLIAVKPAGVGMIVVVEVVVDSVTVLLIVDVTEVVSVIHCVSLTKGQ